ncbi:hypothetical protein E2562_028984 [Oryza meyeriana var. granulata]|uniref:Serine/threonine-protein kinase BSK1-like TPR repeats domain-containing protein n=1 Tax=Oryza meyeriana var. granulata TaxID=110450 RepID=A0A6G1DPG1_9ORYZ|nr:hypothetical protein E2562_028984 [Oryza meyeriana var. granulata]
MDVLSLPNLFEKLLGDDKDSWPPEATLLIAAHDGNLRLVKEIAATLDDDGMGIAATVARTTFHGMNALHAARELHVYRYLLEVANMDVNKPDTTPSRKTPLDHAMAAGDLPSVRYLIDHGADIHHEREGNISMLHLAAKKAQQGCGFSSSNTFSYGVIRFFLTLCEAIDPAFLFVGEHGKMPIELAAVYGTREDVEILFPLTNPIPTVADWSVDGLIAYAKLECKKLEDDDYVKMKLSDLKQEGDGAFEKQDYVNASVWYTRALKVDACDAALLSKRSLCWLRMGEGEKALEDATRCKKLHPKWSEAHHQRGEALMLLKEYEKACEAFTRGLELDPENDEMDKLFWEAMDLKK